MKSKYSLALVLKCWIDTAIYVKFASHKHVNSLMTFEQRPKGVWDSTESNF